MNETGSVKETVVDGIGKITFAHPSGNSLPGYLLKGLTGAVQKFGNDSAVKVIVIESAGEKAFCGGASFDEFLAAANSSASKDFFMGFAHLIMAIRNSPKFVIARVQGKVVGGGVGIVAACDYVLATEAASIRLSELALGIGPFIIGPAIERKIGRSAFSTLAIDTQWRDAHWAMERGLFSDLYKTITDLDKALGELTVRLSKSNPEAMHALKAVFWEGIEPWNQLLASRADTTSKLAVTEFVREIIKSK